MAFNRLNHSILGEIRPRFFLQIHVEPEVAAAHIVAQVRNSKTVACDHSKNLVFLKTPSWLAHYWSPEMTVRIDKDEFSGKITACCLIGPRQSVWVKFTMIYGAIILITLFGGMFGFVQQHTAGSSPFLWFIPIGVNCLASVFVVAKMGQRKGRDQMLYLVSFIYHTLDEITEVTRVERR